MRKMKKEKAGPESTFNLERCPLTRFHKDILNLLFQVKKLCPDKKTASCIKNQSSQRKYYDCQMI